MREIVTILCTNTLPHSVVYLISLSSNNLIQMYYLLWFEPKYYSDPIKKKDLLVHWKQISLWLRAAVVNLPSYNMAL